MLHVHVSLHPCTSAMYTYVFTFLLERTGTFLFRMDFETFSNSIDAVLVIVGWEVYHHKYRSQNFVPWAPTTFAKFSCCISSYKLLFKINVIFFNYVNSSYCLLIVLAHKI